MIRFQSSHHNVARRTQESARAALDVARFSREAATADEFAAAAASRLTSDYGVLLRADARSYVLPSLRD